MTGECVVMLSVFGTILGVWSLIPLLGVLAWASLPTRKHAPRNAQPRPPHE